MRPPRRRCEPRAPLGPELCTRSRAHAHASPHLWQAGLEAAEKKRAETAELLRLTAAELKAVKELLAAKEEARAPTLASPPPPPSPQPSLTLAVTRAWTALELGRDLGLPWTRALALTRNPTSPGPDSRPTAALNSTRTLA